MSNAEQYASTHMTRTADGPSASIAGIFATLRALLGSKGSGAPSSALARERSAVPRTIRSALLCAALSLAFACLFASSAHAAFGVKGYDVTFTNQDGTTATQAGSHPFAMTTSFDLNYDESTIVPEGWLRDFIAKQVPGFVGDTTAYPRCTTADFLAGDQEISNCPLASQVGIAAVSASSPTSWSTTAIFNLTPPPGVLTRLGFTILTAHITIDVGVNPTYPYNVIAASRNTTQVLNVFGTNIQLWGDPSDPAHDTLRGRCGHNEYVVPSGTPFTFKGNGQSCPGGAANPKPFLTLPTTCAEPLLSSYEALSWEGASDSGGVLTHDGANPQPFTGCGKLGFNPSITAQPTTKAATSPTGLDFSLDVTAEGLQSVSGLSQSDIRKAVVTLPEGMSVNPSQAEGLEVCTEANLQADTLGAAPGAGCPQASKIGTVEVTSPLVEEAVDGALYVAAPYHNLAGNSLIALYMVIKNPALGIIVKQPLRVESDPATGRLTTVADEIPQLPFSHFRLHFREGTRSPLVSPPSCGTHEASATLYPWSGGEPITTTSAFQIISGPDNGPCPSGGIPPFHPGLLAGTLNNAAGHFSAFDVRLSRSDSEQEITHFSIKLPPGVVGKLAGIPFCPDAAIAAAKARTGPTGGAEELASPSCPAASAVGRTLVGAGVGPSLAYVPGKLYLAGPYNGSAISIVSITSGVAGPFDLGTVVVREGLKVNPETGEVFIDATGSDPIPHIIKGIPVHLRDIRVYTDRPEFVLNPTDCTRTSTASTLLGAGLDFVSPADDVPVTVSTPFQAADCAALPFKPKLSFRLVGGTKRGANPSLRAHVAMNGIGEAAIKSASVALPRSEFLDNAHIGTVCTRVQFREGAVPGEKCPAASVYGHVSALTPILEGPLEGPIYLRSSEHKLPDLVAALHHAEINVSLVGRVDSVKGGGIRNTFEFVPDAPVTSADFSFDGQAKGLLQNSTNLCRGTHKVTVKLKGHNGKVSNYETPLKAKCPKSSKKHRRSNRSAPR